MAADAAKAPTRLADEEDARLHAPSRGETREDRRFRPTLRHGRCPIGPFLDEQQPVGRSKSASAIPERMVLVDVSSGWGPRFEASGERPWDRPLGKQLESVEQSSALRESSQSSPGRGSGKPPFQDLVRRFRRRQLELMRLSVSWERSEPTKPRRRVWPRGSASRSEYIAERLCSALCGMRADPQRLLVGRRASCPSIPQPKWHPGFPNLGSDAW